MKQRVGIMKPEDEEITQLEATFVAIYSLLLDQIEKEPNKGIVIQKGKPNQYKLRWKDAMLCAHALEDYFTLRDPMKGAAICERCKHWESTSTASPHLGFCRKKKRAMHSLSCCKDLKVYQE